MLLYSEGPSSPNLSSLVPNTIKSMFSGTRNLKYWVLGPSGVELPQLLASHLRPPLAKSGSNLIQMAKVQPFLGCMEKTQAGAPIATSSSRTPERLCWLSYRKAYLHIYVSTYLYVDILESLHT